MVAEAHFLRALSYYNLAICWGDVPLKTTPSSHDGVAVPRSSRLEVLDVVQVTWNLLQNICRKRILMDFQRNGLQKHI